MPYAYACNLHVIVLFTYGIFLLGTQDVIKDTTDEAQQLCYWNNKFYMLIDKEFSVLVLTRVYGCHCGLRALTT